MTGPSSIFDAHVHVGKWLTPDFHGRESDLHDVADTLDRTGIEGALAMPTDAGDNAGLLAEMKDYRGKVDFLFAAWIDPTDTNLNGFLKANAGTIRALKFHPSFSRTPITDDTFRPFLEYAGDNGLPAVVHCGRWLEKAGYELALEAATRYQTVPFILSHMGGDSPGLVMGAANAVSDRRLENVYLGTESIREYWLVGRALELVGPERIVFGSDHNLNHPASFIAVVDALDLPAADRDLILGGNARRLLGI